LGLKNYLINRSFQMIFTLWFTVTLLFILFRLMPGDPLSGVVGTGTVILTPELRQSLMESYGLDKPLHIQYLLYMKNLLTGYLGWSFKYQVPVSTIIGSRVLATLILALSGFVFAYSLAFFGGMFFAREQGTKFDALGIVLSSISRGAPMFWTGMIAISLFSFTFNLFPSSGMHSPGITVNNVFERYFSIDFLHHLVLPTVVSGFYYLGLPLLVFKASLLETLGEDYIEFAKAKGLTKNAVFYKHAARNAILPMLTTGMTLIGLAMGGSLFVEVVFSWPGMGRELVAAVWHRDYPLIQGMFFLIALSIMIMNFLSDILYGILDPRISYD